MKKRKNRTNYNIILKAVGKLPFLFYICSIERHMSKESFFIQHCEEENCDLGTFEYTCDNCDTHGTDYEAWWDQDDIMSGKSSFIFCSHCQQKLSISWDNKQYMFYVDKV